MVWRFVSLPHADSRSAIVGSFDDFSRYLRQRLKEQQAASNARAAAVSAKAREEDAEARAAIAQLMSEFAEKTHGTNKSS